MLELFNAGGFPMLGVVAFGLMALVAAGFFAKRPERGRIGHIVGLSCATICLSFAGTARDIAKVIWFVTTTEDKTESSAIVLAGVGESMSPLIFGFTLVALVAFVCAVGYRRLYREEAE